ncbi:MAG: Lrp/AsnC family transcriptional regulator [Firmicutes bacterium]|nr:Lrp/AsnC family transcriptional regulator [Bacillota bacterium]
MIDETDIRILSILSENGRMQWREVGELVHLSGQAVGNRIRRMEEMGIIEGFTVRVNPDRLGRAVTAYITVFMKNTDHQGFRRFIAEREMVKEAEQISGEGCYMLKVSTSGQEELLHFLGEVLRYGNYRVNLSIARLK